MSTPAKTLRLALTFSTAIGLTLPSLSQAGIATPPARVGQLAAVTGSVSYNGAGSNGQWVAATANYPLTTGDSLFTQANAQAAIAVGSSTLTLAQNTELQIAELDDTSLSANETQGEAFLNLTDLQPGQVVTLTTPRGAITITANGQYDIAAGDASTPTTIAVLSGVASIGQLQVPAGQEGFLSGTDQTTAALGAIQRDDFMNSIVGELAPPPPPYAPPVVQQMTGTAELSRYGDWNQDPQYGAVWYPNVDPGWAPYREGHWAYVAPWGWTWVEAEPWGFAPFHYGRWIQTGPRWGWVPAGAYPGGGYGPSYQPVYAPALVSFVGIGAGVVITAALLSHGNVGWVPLGPGEAYHPYYHADDDYVRRINRVDVRNYQNITVNNYNTTIINYRNRQAATYIPADAMARGDSVAHYGHPMDPGMFAHAQPLHGDAFNQAIHPTYQPREAPAPRPTSFSQRHDAGPPVISHEPVTFHPEGAPGISHPAGFGEVHPPQGGGVMPLHPEAQPVHPEAQPFHPEAPAYHPAPQPVHPEGQPFHPAPQPFHPEAPAYHPEPQYHPQPQAFHPEAHPAPAPEHHDKKH